MKLRYLAMSFAALLVGVALAAACGGDDDDDGGDGPLGSQKVNDHGTKDVRGAASIALEADDFYFNP
ncbi:MAG: hypothetical protein ACR2HN_00685, partial [Tepidiformaceae bacterium]